MTGMEGPVREALQGRLDDIDMPDRLDLILQRARTERRNRSIAFAVTAASLSAMVAWAGIALTNRSEPLETIGPGPGTTEIQGTDFDGWKVTIGVNQGSIGPLELEVGPARAAEPNDAHAWIQHDLILRNTGDQPLHFEDTRTAQFLEEGDVRVLLAADRGCGYGLDDPDADAETACQLDLEFLVVEPGETVQREITIFKDLPGMGALVNGTFTFSKALRFRIGSAGEFHGTTVGISYTLERSDAAEDSSLLVVQRIHEAGPVIGSEGSVSFARIETPNGEVLAEEGFDAPPHPGSDGYGYPRVLEVPLNPGRYQMFSYQRSCSGNCEILDPPADDFSCRIDVHVLPSRSVRAEVIIHRNGCRIEYAQRFTLRTHCGLSHPLDFGNRYWLPVDRALRETHSPPEGFGGDENEDHGSLLVRSASAIVYTSSNGVEVEYEPTDRRPGRCE